MDELGSHEIKQVLITEAELREKVAELGERITADFSGKNLMVISVLKGSVIFLADLIRSISLPLKMDFMSVSSYGNGVESSGVVKLIKDLDESIEGRDVVLVEDIMDSGRTLSYLVKILKERKPNSFRIITLLDKPERRVVDLEPDMTCFVIPDRFVVGYGLDCAQKYRNLPFIGVIEK